ncbi:hypothetical protein GCM10023063_21120 [Arthrobacter methylotrophus]
MPVVSPANARKWVLRRDKRRTELNMCVLSSSNFAATGAADPAYFQVIDGQGTLRAVLLSARPNHYGVPNPSGSEHI